MTSLQEKALRKILKRQSDAVRRQCTRMANGEISPKSFAEMISRYENEVVDFARSVSGAEYLSTDWKM